MTVLIDTNSTTTVTANTAFGTWIIAEGVYVATTSLAIDGTGTNGSKSFFVDGHVSSSSTNAISLGDESTVTGGLNNVYISLTGSVESSAPFSTEAASVSSFGGGLSLTNLGSIFSSYDGIVADGSNDITNVGVISADHDAIQVSGTSTNNIDNTGFIRGAEHCINAPNGGSNQFYNSGTLKGGIGIEVLSSSASDIRNTGNITTTRFGVHISGGTGNSLFNSGLIDAGEFSAVRFESSSSTEIVNTGTIATESLGTVAVVLSTSAANVNNTLINHGVIIGQGSAVSTGDGDETVVNRGTIIGDVEMSGGNDTYDGRHGEINSAVLGGTGNDTYIVDDPTIALVENAGEGTDLVKANSSFTLGANFEKLTLIGDGNTRGIGNGLANTITGNSGDNVLNGLGGSDNLHGHTGDDVLRGASGTDLLVGDSGDDRLYGGAQNDTLQGGDDDDTLVGGDGNDKLVGGNDDDTLYGGAGNDIVNGGAGDDHLVGGLGKDIYTGGTGADVFVFRSAIESVIGSNRDRIQDFGHAQGDQIDLSAIDANANTAGDDGFAIVGAYSHTAGELRITTGSGNSTIHGDINGDAHDDFQIFVKGVIDLTAADFLL